MKHGYGAALALMMAVTGCDGADQSAVSGTITMPADKAAKLGASDVLFITARPAGVKGGPPLAVLKIVGMKFPLAYSIGQEDVIMPGQFFRGKVELTALIRKSGIATVPVPGDLRAVYPRPVDAGAKGIDLDLTTPDEGASAPARS